MKAVRSAFRLLPRQLRFGLRPQLLAALVLIAVVTLATAAIALLAPLQSRLNDDAVSLGKTLVENAKTSFGIIALGPDGRPPRHRIDVAARSLGRRNRLVGVVVWSQNPLTPAGGTRVDRDALKPNLAARAFRFPAQAQSQEVDGLLEVAARYRAPSPRPNVGGAYYVLEIFRPLDYVGATDGVVQSAFLEAALVGLFVAILLGIAFSSRLLRRVRLLRDASLSFDERDLTPLTLPEDTTPDELGDLARGFSAMHARLRQQEDARRAFVATASHELRTPLTSLDGMLELLADDLAGDAVDLVDARGRVARAQIQSRRLAGLATDLLDLSRLDAQLPLRSEPVALGETARAVAAEFDARARERRVEIVLREGAGERWAQADPGSVARIVRILLDNALRVAPEESSIEVRIASAGAPSIEVVDRGPGVPAAERELIFERFQRGRQRNDGGGFGLGLAIASELAARMAGTVELTDAQPGASFRVTLPEVAGR